MLRHDILSVVLVSIYTIIYLILLQYANSVRIPILMALFFPFLLIWMIYTILKFGKYEGPELGEEEFGYQDRKKSDLGTF